MELAQIVEGKTYQYYPVAQGGSDNEHYPATVVEVRKRIKVKLISAAYPEGVEKWVSPRRLLDQLDLLN